MTDLVSFVNQSSATSGSSTSITGLADNFDTFLTLLTTQMQNQDPLAPLDSTEFTNQLVQFSSVEQQIRTNQSIESLVASSNASTGAALSGYLGQTAEINSAAQGFQGEDVTWSYTLSDDAAEANILIQDAQGRPVFSGSLENAAGTHDFTWNGKNSSGDQVPVGEAYLATITATNANGDAVSTQIRVKAKVTGVDMSYDDPAVTTTAGVFSYSDVLRIS